MRRLATNEQSSPGPSPAQMSVNIVLSTSICQRTALNLTVLTDSTSEVTSIMLFDHRLVTSRLVTPSLHDAECKMRDTCALDHLGAFQLDRFRGLVEQPDAIPE